MYISVSIIKQFWCIFLSACLTENNGICPKYHCLKMCIHENAVYKIELPEKAIVRDVRPPDFRHFKVLLCDLFSLAFVSLFYDWERKFPSGWNYFKPWFDFSQFSFYGLACTCTYGRGTRFNYSSGKVNALFCTRFTHYTYLEAFYVIKFNVFMCIWFHMQASFGFFELLYSPGEEDWYKKWNCKRENWKGHGK